MVRYSSDVADLNYITMPINQVQYVVPVFVNEVFNFLLVYAGRNLLKILRKSAKRVGSKSASFITLSLRYRLATTTSALI